MTNSNPDVKCSAQEWIIDSGASDHMTPCIHNLSQPSLTQNLRKINLPTGDTASISHIGDVHRANGLELKQVLCVPHFKHSLLSVQKLIKDSKCEIQFHPDHCTIVDSSTRKIKGIGKVRNGLYYLENDELNITCDIKCLTAEKNTINSQKPNPLELWHYRLGHAPVAKLKHIPDISPFTNENPRVCVTCPMSKFPRLPFSLSQSRAAEPFDLVHMDIWGPYKVCTKGKYRFFLTLVDDNTRATWVYLLEYKSESLATLEVFMNYALTHFNKKIKFIRSDNALEFDDKPCQAFFAKHGISHQTSCVKRPQQNARVERKH